MVELLNAKVDAIASDSTSENIVDEIDEIKNIIFEQRKFFELASDEKSAAIDKYLRDVLVKLDNVDIEKNAEDIKESIMNALVSLIDQVSFVEEAEDIKDFVEEKTDEINKNIQEVQSQLKQLATADDDSFDYKYTLQDVESDIARLRLAMNNMQNIDFSDITNEIQKITKTVETLQSSLTQDQLEELKTNFEKISEDIVSISSRTNKLLLNSDESYKALNDGLNNFSELINKLEDRINYLDNTEITERIEKKIDKIQNLSTESVNANKVSHQVMMYLGEWVDSTTERLSSISDKTVLIPEIQNDIEEIKTTIPDKNEIVNEIKEYIPSKYEIADEIKDFIPNKNELVDEIKGKIPDKEEILDEIRQMMPNNSSVIDKLEVIFARQEERIDVLENKIEKILSTLEQKDDMVLNRKVDKIERLISGLGANIEKLTSYVDEE